VSAVGVSAVASGAGALGGHVSRRLRASSTLRMSARVRRGGPRGAAGARRGGMPWNAEGIVRVDAIRFSNAYVETEDGLVMVDAGTALWAAPDAIAGASRR
jgi:hypothetical protein